MSEVTVRLTRDPDTAKYVFQVSVYSNKKQGFKANSSVDPAQADNPKKLIQLIEAAGGACAEYLCEKYGESHDPSSCAKAAVEDFQRELGLVQELKKGFPEKLARLARYPLLDPERKSIMLIKFSIDRGGNPTQEDSMYVNTLMARYGRRKG